MKISFWYAPLANVHTRWLDMPLCAGILSWVLACRTVEKQNKTAKFQLKRYWKISFNFLMHWKRASENILLHSCFSPKAVSVCITVHKHWWNFFLTVALSLFSYDMAWLSTMMTHRTASASPAPPLGWVPSSCRRWVEMTRLVQRLTPVWPCLDQWCSGQHTQMEMLKSLANQSSRSGQSS